MQDIVENKLGITTETEFDLCHCTRKFKKNLSKPRAIVCRLLRFKDKEKKFAKFKKVREYRFFHLQRLL